MSDMYRLTLRKDPEGSQILSRQELGTRLSRIPNLSDEGDGLYRFGEPDEHGAMEVELLLVRDGVETPVSKLSADEADRYNTIEVRVPRPWVMAKGPQVFAIVFMMAGWNNWPVYDEQIQDTLEKDVVLQGLVAMRQAALEAEGRGGPSRNDGA